MRRGMPIDGAAAMHQAPSRSAAALALVVVFAACGTPASDPAPSAADTADGVADAAAPRPSLQQIQDLGVRNAAMPIEGVVTAAQITEEQLHALRDMGYERFVSLRPRDEDGAGWEEAHVTEHDESFSRVPVDGSAGLTRENVEALDRILDEAASEGAVVYCASSNRVGALLALRAYWLEGAAADDALALGRAAGLRGLEGPVGELLSEPR